MIANKLTTAQLSELSNKSVATLTRWIAKGKISANRTENGFEFDISEALRVFPEITPDNIEKVLNNQPIEKTSVQVKLTEESEFDSMPETNEMNSTSNTADVLKLKSQIEVLKAKLELEGHKVSLLEEQCRKLERREDDVKDEKERLMIIIERSQLLLENSIEKTDSVKTKNFLEKIKDMF